SPGWSSPKGTLSICRVADRQTAHLHDFSQRCFGYPKIAFLPSVLPTVHRSVMIPIRRLSYLMSAAAFGLLATPGVAAAAPSDVGRMTARWASVRAPAVAQAVMIDGKWHAAGQAYIRVDGQADAAVYSLSLATEVDRSAQLEAIDSDSSAIANLPQITSL